MRRQNKYNNIKTEVDGITFDSKAEARRYKELCQLKAAGAIRGFGRQPSFVIQGGRYRPDFVVCGAHGEIWLEDVKGVETAVFKRSAKQMAEAYPWLSLIILK